jgi:hypothetical protein
MSNRLLRWAGVMAVAGSFPHRLPAQIDYRNSERGQPLRVEDAYPIERSALEWSLSGRIQFAGSTTVAYQAVPELSFGLIRNLALGLGVPVDLWHRSAGSSVRAEVFSLYNLTGETVHWPALAIRVDGATSFEDGGGAATVSGIATRSFGANRLHLNGTVALAQDGEETPSWWIGAGIDHTFIRSSLLLLAEATVERDRRIGATRTFLGVGLRRQMTPTLVLSLGARRAFTAGTPGEIAIGVSHAFGWSALVPGRKP